MSAGQQAVPANNANNASNEGAQKKHMSKAAVAIIAVVVVAIIVVAGVFGFRAYSDAQYNNAVASGYMSSAPSLRAPPLPKMCATPLMTTTTWSMAMLPKLLRSPRRM